MSQYKDRDSIDHDFFEESQETLAVGSQLPFDCFLLLEKNGRLIRWIRSNSSFTEAHRQKLEKHGGRVFIRKSQHESFKEYLQVHNLDESHSLGKTLESSESPITYGAVSQEEDETVVFGKALLAPETHHVRGTNPQRDLLVHVKGGEKNKKSKIPPKVKVDVDFLNCLIQHTQDVFFEVCGVPIQFKTPFNRRGKNYKGLDVEVASLISVVSQTIRGSIGLCFPRATYLNLINELTGGQQDLVSSELAMGASELMYAIFESARAPLGNLGYEVERAIPLLVTGSNLSMPHLIPDLGFNIIFDSRIGPFQFEIGIKTGG